MCILWLCNNVMFSHYFGVVMKSLSHPRTMKYEYVKLGVTLIRPMICIYVKKYLKILQEKGNLVSH